jgi:hypothetical protein
MKRPKHPALMITTSETKGVHYARIELGFFTSQEDAQAVAVVAAACLSFDKKTMELWAKFCPSAKAAN